MVGACTHSIVSDSVPEAAGGRSKLSPTLYKDCRESTAVGVLGMPGYNINTLLLISISD